MSRALINRNPDLRRLQDDGYDIRIVAQHLAMDVPYVNSRREVRRGTLVSTLALNADMTMRPDNHVMMFAGEHPCDQHGAELARIKHASNRQVIAEGLTVEYSFSSKPTDGYADYYEKMTTYANILWGPAHAIDPRCTPRTYPVLLADDDESVFLYLDTASSRAGITGVNAKLAMPKLAIIGIGGTGSYVLDLVAKTPPGEIHLFDGDRFLQHNAFRSPGAASKDQLAQRWNKAEYFAAQYAPMRRGIIAHPYHITPDNVWDLDEMSFVFLCMDKGVPKAPIIEHFEARGIPFIDVGMGINLIDNALQGMLRVTTSTPAKRDHVRQRVSLADPAVDDEYHHNIQIADLNALNAALAVMRWKKYCGFYHDLEREHHTTLSIDGNHLLNEEHA